MSCQEDSSVDWTWGRGLSKAACWSFVSALVIAGGLNLVARHYPLLVFNAWLRMSLAFLVTCLLFTVVHRAAGMAGNVCTALVVVLTAAIFVSQHWVFAHYGMLVTSGRTLAGPFWLDPRTIMATNSTAAIGLLAAALLCHGGGSIWRAVVELMGTHIRG